MTGRILVVDDEEDVRVLMDVVLSSMGHEIHQAADGSEALAALAQQLYDLVLLDLRMPGIDGWGVLARLNSEQRLPSLQVVTVSAHADEEMRKEALRLGCVAYLVKPFTPHELRELVGGLVGDGQG